MSLRYSILSLLALFLILLLVFKNYEIWTAPVAVVPEKGTSKKSGTKGENPPAMAGQKEPASVESYVLIAEKNIFTTNRKEFPVVVDPAKEKKPIVRPQVTLYGVTIAGEYKSASIAYSGRVLRKGERETLTVKIGEQIGGYKLAKILPDRISLEAPEDTFEVFLYNEMMPKKRSYAKTENKPATITTTLAAAPTPGGPPQAAPPAGGTPGDPARGGITEAAMPRPVTPATVPSPRRRVPVPSRSTGTSGTSLYDVLRERGEM